MANKFVTVNITRQTKTVSQKGFGIPLIFTGDKVQAYKEYSGDTALADVSTDFGPASKTYKLVEKMLSQPLKVDKFAIFGIVFVEGTTPTTNIASNLNTLVTTNDDWFYLLSTLQADASVTALSAWAATVEKLYFASTSSKTLANTLTANGNTIVMVHDDPANNYPSAAWVGAVAPLDFGSYTWTFKTLNAVTAANYNPSDIALIETNKGNTYVKQGGVNITTNSKTTNGDYVDVIQSQYYLKSKMIENVFALLSAQDKIPFTDNGIALVAATVEKTLKDAYNIGIIADDADGKPMFTVTVPKREDVAASDRANRLLPGVKWSCTIAGAVEKVDIAGTLLV